LEIRIPNSAGETGRASSAHEAGRRRKSDAGGRELFSGFHFAMDVWGNWRLNFLSREGREGGEVRRTGIFVETAA
jgi:hypothetical protein